MSEKQKNKSATSQTPNHNPLEYCLLALFNFFFCVCGLHGCTNDSSFVFNNAGLSVSPIKIKHHIFKGQFTELHEFEKPSGLFSSTISSYKKERCQKIRFYIGRKFCTVCCLLFHVLAAFPCEVCHLSPYIAYKQWLKVRRNREEADAGTKVWKQFPIFEQNYILASTMCTFQRTASFRSADTEWLCSILLSGVHLDIF